MITYIATIHKDNDSDYGVQFYDFPGCISVGETIEEAKVMATEALNGHINLILADGEQIPEPSTLETILNDADHQDAVAFMTIEISDTILAKLELYAKI
ncbi:type II toxin-antitoxin system HicB family antitoxin [Crocosphaera sp. UHCC 0190]|uniref:type II toxin-antitoxin system HicB family antitoxin n=1 Tax=Crocosphaera sp. UHCC 0190 TaxID=3110246 RepID=UPI002B20495B|nr:type II toxin-antitoxin system HicB family antitoxin [Crocosphaera sp. UHCC 0190]MEA5511593.1 type II toxin-antitoxin system HicB family antitoxin [Crocosphaera sp. UHCC 0190]